MRTTINLDEALLDEAQRVDPDREQRLRKTVWELVNTAN